MNTPSQADTSAVANQLVRLMTAGTTERELVATVARAFPDLERREFLCRPAGRDRSRGEARCQGAGRAASPRPDLIC